MISRPGTAHESAQHTALLCVSTHELCLHTYERLLTPCRGQLLVCPGQPCVCTQSSQCALLYTQLPDRSVGLICSLFLCTLAYYRTFCTMHDSECAAEALKPKVK